MTRRIRWELFTTIWQSGFLLHLMAHAATNRERSEVQLKELLRLVWMLAPNREDA